MRITSIICPECGKYLTDIAGLGETAPRLFCNNSGCLSHFRHIKCPKCSSGIKSVKILGLGHQLFTCKECNHVWSSLD